ncbi:MAG: RNA-binding S4 domain-containing protein [Gammaproteobacteria bacterium]|nr:RNA-binding S4 domain-containing protein [Gammaproteobacteria bacterium]
MPEATQRLDRWLWAARFFKTRQLASEAVKGGKVHVNGARAKPSKAIGPGDRLRITRGPYTYTVHIDALSPRRVSAKQAQALYTESEQSTEARERLAVQLKSAAAQIAYDPHRPPARTQRRLREIKRGTDQ